MLTTKYKPNTIDKFVGNHDIIPTFLKWLLEWDSSNMKSKCALISGLCGIGKNLFVDIMLHKHDYHAIHLALDDDRDKTYINNVIKPLIRTKKTCTDQEMIIVASDIDCSGGDYGFIAALTDIIKHTQIPVICICNNRYDQSIKPILNYCVDFKMSKPKYSEVYALVYDIVINEKIKIKEKEIKELYEQSNGDIRFILNSLQFGYANMMKNIQSNNIFDTTGKMLSMDETIERKYELYWLSNDLHPLMIQENYVNSTLNASNPANKMANLSYSADAISDMDLFETRVNMASWEFEPYVAMQTIKAASKCNKKGMIKFPQYLGRISTINKNKREKINETNGVKKEVVEQPKTKTPKKGGSKPKAERKKK